MVHELSGGQGQTVYVVLSVLEEFGGCRIYAEIDILAGLVSGIRNGLHYGPESLGDRVHRRSESALVPDIDGTDPVFGLQYALEGRIGLRGHPEALGEAGSPCGYDHALLDLQIASGVLAPVDDVEHGDGQGDVVLPDVLVKLLVADERPRIRHCERYGRGRVPADGLLVVGAVSLHHGHVYGPLIRGIHAHYRLGHGRADVLYGLQDTFSAVPVASVTELVGLVHPGRGPGRCDGRDLVTVDGHDGLHSGVAPGIKYLSCPNLLDLCQKSFLLV